MAVEVTPVRTRSDLDAFIRLPYRIFADDPYYVPPLEMDVRERLDKTKNPFFEHADGELFLARDGAEVLGRISAQVDQEHLRIHGEKVGFFGFFDAFERQDVATALFSAAEGWCKEREMERIRGPFCLSINEELGFLVYGFDSPPMIMMQHSKPYYATIVEGAGYEKAKDIYAWKYVVGEVPKRARKGSDEVKALPELKLRSVDMKNFDRDIRIVMDVFNDAWSENWGFVPMTEAELSKAAKDLKMILDPAIAFIAEIEGAPAAIAVAVPNINEAIHDLGGRLFPFGMFKLLWRLKVRRLKSARLMLLGIRKKYRGVKRYGGLAFHLYAQMNDRAKARGYEYGELSWTLEDNFPVNIGIKVMGGIAYKTYRIYEKAL